MPRPPLLLPIAALVLLPACVDTGAGDSADGASTRPAGGGVSVVASTTILGDLVTQLVGEDGSVTVLMEPGQDPHGFAPSARQAAQLRDADLVVVNGLGLEEQMTDVLDAAAADGADVLHVAETVDPLEFDGEHGHDDEESGGDDDHDADEADHAEGSGDHEGHDHGPLDPHVWLDPVRMAHAVDVIADRLAGITPEVDWEVRADSVTADLLAAHDEVVRTLDMLPEACRQLVTNHDALAYLADRYGLEVIGTVIPGSSTQVSTSTRGFADLVDLLQDTGVPAVFADNTSNQDLARTLSGEVGRDIEVVDLYTGSLGEPGSGADTYVGMLTTNAQRIADALVDC